MAYLDWIIGHWFLVLAIYVVAFTIYAVTVARATIRDERTRANLNRPLYSNGDTDPDPLTESIPVTRSDTGADYDGDGATIVTAKRAFDSGNRGGSIHRFGGIPGDHRHAFVSGTVRTDQASLSDS